MVLRCSVSDRRKQTYCVSIPYRYGTPNQNRNDTQRQSYVSIPYRYGTPYRNALNLFCLKAYVSIPYRYGTPKTE